MSDHDDQDLTIKLLRERNAELEVKLKDAEHRLELASHGIGRLRHEVAQLRADLMRIYDAQNG
ncbi:MAG: hypothetical protein EOP89_01450 [Lysobacteraceae bacterium]|nr:MAG: hypothetical protein EOP89_01450 [Xanthomonadaceae bacterium]